MALLKTGVLALGVLFAPPNCLTYIFIRSQRAPLPEGFLFCGVGRGSIFSIVCRSGRRSRTGWAAPPPLPAFLSRCWTAALSSRFVGRLVCEIKGDEFEGGGVGWGGGAALALAGRHSGAIRGVSRALLCALSCRALRCLRVHHNTNTK